MNALNGTPGKGVPTASAFNISKVFFPDCRINFASLGESRNFTTGICVYCSTDSASFIVFLHQPRCSLILLVRDDP